MACPVCGSRKFHLKDPNDHFSIFGFEMKDRKPQFLDDVEPEEVPEITPVTEAYCNICAWHAKLSEI